MPRLRFALVRLDFGEADGNVEKQNLHSPIKIRLDRIASCRESSARAIHLFGIEIKPPAIFSVPVYFWFEKLN